jgi:RHS repeat-associated protein
MHTEMTAPGKTLAIILALALWLLAALPASSRADEEAPADQAVVQTQEDDGSSDTPDDDAPPAEVIEPTPEELAAAEAPSVDLIQDESKQAASVVQGIESSSNGAAKTSLKLFVPPGRGGLAPELTVTYDSQRGNGWLGVGWDLEVGAIRRSTKHGVSYTGTQFELQQPDGSGELVQVESGHYRKKIEDEFADYRYDSGNDFWKVTRKNGHVYTYGTLDASREAFGGLDTFKWHLEKIADNNNNEITYSYANSGVANDDHAYLFTISYNYNNIIRFYLEDRDDDPYDYRPLAKDIINKRLRSIAIYSNGSKVKAYAFTYHQSGSTGKTLLANIVEYGNTFSVASDGTISGAPSLPLISATYNEAGQTWTDKADEGFGGVTWQSDTGNRHAAVGDFDGNGYDDVMTVEYESFASNVVTEEETTNAASQVVIYSGSASGFTSSRGNVPTLTVSATSTSRHYDTGDYDFDGMSDVAEYGFDYANVFLHQNGTSWPKRTLASGTVKDRFGYGADFDGNFISDFRVHTESDTDGNIDYEYTTCWNGAGAGTSESDSAPSYNGSYPYVALAADFTGDGVADIAYPEKNTLLKWNGTQFQSIKIDKNAQTNTDPFGGGSGVWTKYQAGDFNGDGIADLFRLRAGSGYLYIDVAISMGGGNWDIHTDTQEGIYYGYQDPPGAQVADWNGDGISDVAYYNSANNSQKKKRHVLYGKGDGTWLDVGLDVNPPVLENLPNGKYLAGDFNGDGKADIISTDGTRASISDGSKPDQLVTLTNRFGGTTTIAYTPSSAYVNGYLPYTVSVVSSVKYEDQSSPTATTLYSYAGGYHDKEDREFRGFHEVSRTNPDGTKTIRTYFDQTDDFRKGRLVSETEKSVSGLQLKKTDYAWTRDAIVSNFCYFVAIKTRTTTYEDNNSKHIESHNYNTTNGNIILTKMSGTGAVAIGKAYTYWTPTSGSKAGILYLVQSEKIAELNSNDDLQTLVRDTSYTYYSNGNLNTKSVAGRTTTWGYDQYGNIVSESDPNHQVTTTAWDNGTFPKTVTRPQTGTVPHVSSQVYNSGFGKLTSEIDENDKERTYNYDTFGRLTDASYPDGGHIQLSYTEFSSNPLSPCSVRMQTKSQIGNTTTIDTYLWFDGQGRTVQKAELGTGGKVVTRTDYDVMGRPSSVRGPFYYSGGYAWPMNPTGSFPQTDYVYDGLGRVVKETIDDPTPENIVTNYAYSGFQVTITDPDTNSVTTVKDHLDRIIQVVEPGSLTTSYGYNAAGDLTSITDATRNINNMVTMTYDLAGRKTSETDPDIGYRKYIYDSAGNLTNEQWAVQSDSPWTRQIVTTYDALNRPLTKTFSKSSASIAATSNVTYHYDSATNGVGLPAEVINDFAVRTVGAYDAMGRKTSETLAIDGKELTTAYAYDLAGRPTSVTHPDGTTVTTSYFAGMNLVQSVSGGATATATGYNPAGKITGLSYGGGLANVTYAYDPQSMRLTAITGTDKDGTTVFSRQYVYTKAGDVSRMYLIGSANVYDCIYDGLHRLTELKHSETTAIRWTYDNVGNMKSAQTLNGATAWGYSAIGERRQVVYDVRNMPVAVQSQGGDTLFVYDGDGRRVKKLAPGRDKRYYVTDTFELVNGQPTISLFFGNVRFAQWNGAATYFIRDHLNSASVALDGTGAVVESAEYLPFGAARQAGVEITSTDYTFTDQEKDRSTGFYNYDARHYDPNASRFISPDSLLPNPYDPQQLNRYAYARNNPLKYVDPSGHQSGDIDKEITDSSDEAKQDSEPNSDTKQKSNDDGINFGISKSFSYNIVGVGETIDEYGNVTRTYTLVDLGGVSVDITIGPQPDPDQPVVEFGFGIGDILGVGVYFGDPDIFGNPTTTGLSLHVGIGFGSPMYGSVSIPKDPDVRNFPAN